MSHCLHIFEFVLRVLQSSFPSQYSPKSLSKVQRNEYESLVGSNETLHRHILKCLKSEVSEKLITGKIGYMKRMWKWLTNHEWEIYEDRINEQTTHKQKEDLYGTEIL